LKESHLTGIPKWNADENILDSKDGKEWLEYLESEGVFFSSPLDLDFMMLQAFPEAYGISEEDLEDPDETTTSCVLGASFHGPEQYNEDEQKLFSAYFRKFKQGSKPAAHIGALASMSDKKIAKDVPTVVDRLIAAVKERLAEFRE
jgi:putative ATP-dependent endonuclease of OLD family